MLGKRPRQKEAGQRGEGDGYDRLRKHFSDSRQDSLVFRALLRSKVIRRRDNLGEVVASSTIGQIGRGEGGGVVRLRFEGLDVFLAGSFAEASPPLKREIV